LSSFGVIDELFESEIAELQAKLSESRVKEKLALAVPLIKEAEAIEQNIKTEEATPEYQALEGKELYEANQEKKEAEKIAQSKRQAAKQEEEEANASRETVKHFRRTAAASRETANRLRRL
jgi:hypothetical protein